MKKTRLLLLMVSQGIMKYLRTLLQYYNYDIGYIKNNQIKGENKSRKEVENIEYFRDIYLSKNHVLDPNKNNRDYGDLTYNFDFDIDSLIRENKRNLHVSVVEYRKQGGGKKKTKKKTVKKTSRKKTKRKENNNRGKDKTKNRMLVCL